MKFPDNASPLIKDLFSKILTHNSIKRLSIHEILAHEFFQRKIVKNTKNFEISSQTSRNQNKGFLQFFENISQMSCRGNKENSVFGSNHENCSSKYKGKTSFIQGKNELLDKSKEKSIFFNKSKENSKEKTIEKSLEKSLEKSIGKSIEKSIEKTKEKKNKRNTSFFEKSNENSLFFNKSKGKTQENTSFIEKSSENMHILKEKRRNNTVHISSNIANPQRSGYVTINFLLKNPIKSFIFL